MSGNQLTHVHGKDARGTAQGEAGLAYLPALGRFGETDRLPIQYGRQQVGFPAVTVTPERFKGPRFQTDQVGVADVQIVCSIAVIVIQITGVVMVHGGKFRSGSTALLVSLLQDLEPLPCGGGTFGVFEYRTNANSVSVTEGGQLFVAVPHLLTFTVVRIITLIFLVGIFIEVNRESFAFSRLYRRVKRRSAPVIALDKDG